MGLREEVKGESRYREELLGEVIPFWEGHGIDREHGGVLTGLDREGKLIDDDKAVWLQGRAAWTFGRLYNKVEKREEWLEYSRETLKFIRERCRSESGKLYFQVTREGEPLRMRRYYFSECFAAMGSAVYAKASGEGRAAEEAVEYFRRYLSSLKEGGVEAKVDARTRPMRGSATQMMLIVVSQELREVFGDEEVEGRRYSEWIDSGVEEIEKYLYKPEEKVLMEVVGKNGEVLDHFDGRTLNPGHAIECAWFILHEAKKRGDRHLKELGLSILDCMWERGWDKEYGGLHSYTDLRGHPVQEYNADMKFWWPHNEAEIAMLLAWDMTGEEKYLGWYRQVRDWSRKTFRDAEYGEWYGYAHRDGTISTQLKGNMWKGPFHLPRMLMYCGELLGDLPGGEK